MRRAVKAGFMTEKYNNINYLIEFPEKYNNREKYPVIIFIHGAGSRGNDVNILKNQVIYKYKKEHADFPFILVLPQCHRDSWFDIFEQLQDFVMYISAQQYADKSRIYICGASMGGYTSYQLLMSLPDLFAAGAICCGGGMYWNAARINAPLLIFHGKEDTTVYPCESVNMYEALKRENKEAYLFLLDNTAHDSWTYAFNNSDTYKFLLRHKKEHKENIGGI